MEDSRGTVVRRIEHLQTFLTASEVDRLVGDYLDGATVKELADRYGMHRATVSAHLTRRRVARRRPRLGVEEAAEAVRLHLGGVSIRSIARSMGLSRRAVRAALIEAKVLSEVGSSSASACCPNAAARADVHRRYSLPILRSSCSQAWTVAAMVSSADRSTDL